MSPEVSIASMPYNNLNICDPKTNAIYLSLKLSFYFQKLMRFTFLSNFAFIRYYNKWLIFANLSVKAY